jgi:SPP1 family predicted phage head-tail adaptor
MTQQITLQTVAITQDSELNPVPAWTDWLTVWAEPMDETSREFYRLATNNTEITKVFRIRYMAGVTSRLRIRFKGRYLELIGDPVNEGERSISLLLSCKAVV